MYPRRTLLSIEKNKLVMSQHLLKQDCGHIEPLLSYFGREELFSWWGDKCLCHSDVSLTLMVHPLHAT